MTRKIKVLFLGEMISSHAQSWVGLLDNARDQFSLLGFGVPGSAYPDQSKIPLFRLPKRLLTSHKLPQWIRNLILHAVITVFRPDVIHTFAAFPTSVLYAPVIRRFQPRIKWVMQVRGGPDVYLNRENADKRALLVSLFKSCDVLIADNEMNYALAVEMGLEADKAWKYGIAPGTGGVDLKDFEEALPPSQSEKRIIWPKAYQGQESNGLPVVEAIERAWPHIEGAKFVFAASDSTIAGRVKSLPVEIQEHIELKIRIPRDEMLHLMKNSRVVMAPSMLEGVPNSLYEAMAARCVPIYSPLETYVHKFEEDETILFADNNSPEQIAAALIKAINDDRMADRIAANNVELVREIANREKIAASLIDLYKRLAAHPADQRFKQ